MENIDIHKKQIATGFITPKGYYDTFEKELFTKLSLEKPVKTIPFYQKKSVWIRSIAAVFVLSFMLTFYYKQNLAQPSTDELANYLLENQNISSSQLVEYLDENDLGNLKTTEKEQFTEDYLIEHTSLELYLD